MKLKRTSKLIALAGAVAMTPALALATISVGDELGTSAEAIRAQLEKQGYTVTEFEFETDEGEYEFEATKDGLEIEFVVTEAGKVIEIELEDEAEMDDDEGDED